MDVILYQPEIPPNTGNIARLCAAAAMPLHLVKPLGFSLEDKHLKRAGLDYWPDVELKVWEDWDTFIKTQPDKRLVLTSARTGIPFHRFQFQMDDGLVFGPETRGLPGSLFQQHPGRVINIPIRGRVRSLNLSTAAGIVLYEAMRQSGLLDQ